MCPEHCRGKEGWESFLRPLYTRNLLNLVLTKNKLRQNEVANQRETSSCEDVFENCAILQACFFMFGVFPLFPPTPHYPRQLCYCSPSVPLLLTGGGRGRGSKQAWRKEKDRIFSSSPPFALTNSFLCLRLFYELTLKGRCCKCCLFARTFFCLFQSILIAVRGDSSSLRRA